MTKASKGPCATVTPSDSRDGTSSEGDYSLARLFGKPKPRSKWLRSKWLANPLDPKANSTKARAAQSVGGDVGCHPEPKGPQNYRTDE